MSIKYKFLSTAFYESIKISILLTTRKRVFTSSKSYIYFNWGILWDLFSPMILVIGFAFLVSIGIRGNGSILDVMIFLFLFWFGFSFLVSKVINLSIPEFQIAKREIQPWIVIFGEFIINCFGIFIRFLLCLFIMKILNYNIAIFHLTAVFILICLFGFFYSVLVSAIFHNNSFITDIHVYLLQVLFFTSSIIIPVPALPDNIRNILLYNPLVHLFEWLKVPYSGISYNFIDINYFLLFLFCIAIVGPISLYTKQNLILKDRAF